MMRQACALRLADVAATAIGPLAGCRGTRLIRDWSVSYGGSWCTPLASVHRSARNPYRGRHTTNAPPDPPFGLLAASAAVKTRGRVVTPADTHRVDTHRPSASAVRRCGMRRGSPWRAPRD